MDLTIQEESLIKVIRALPADEADKILHWAAQLADLGGAPKIEWSDSWSDEDVADATADSLRRFDESEA